MLNHVKPYYTQTLHGTAIYAYIGVVLGVNVGIYGKHGVSGIALKSKDNTLPGLRRRWFRHV